MSQSPNANQSFPVHSNQLLWLLLVISVLLIAALIHFHGFVQNLPYHLNSDEPNIWLWVNYINRTGQLDSTYPPLRLIDLATEFWLLNVITPGDASQTAQFVVGRVSTISYTLLLLAVTYRAGKQLHSPGAGIAAAIYLLAQRQVVELSNIFKVDNAAWFWGMVCLLLALVAIHKRRRGLIFGCFAAGIAASLSKYTMLPILAAPAILMIVLFPRNWLERGIIFLVGALIGLGVAIIVLSPDAILLKLSPSHSYVLKALYARNGVLQFVSISQIWPSLLISIGNLYLIVAIAGLLAAPVLARRSKFSTSDALRIAILVMPMLGTYLMMAMLPIGSQRPHDRMVIVLCFALIFGVSAAILLRHRVLTAFAALILVAPWIFGAWRAHSTLTRPDTRSLTADWFIQHVPEGVHIAVEYDRVEFDAAYGGFPSSKIYFLETLDSKDDYSINGLAMHGFEYLVADRRSEFRGGLFDASADHRVFRKSLEAVLDLTDPGKQGWNGPDRIVYRIAPPQQVPMHVFLGNEIIFKGYDLPAQSFKPGSTIPLVLYWAALQATDHEYMVFVHIYASDGTLVAQLDGPPGDAAHRTFQWGPGYFDADEWPIQLPNNILVGSYTMKVGMYDRDTQIRLQATDADGTVLGDAILLTDIEVSR